MSDQKIEAPTSEDINRIAHALIHAELIVEEALGLKLDGTRKDLASIQRLLDSGTIEKESTYTLQALGMAFGKVFIHENQGFDWWMIEDEYGRDPAIRYQQTTLLAFPQSMLSKRVEDGEVFDTIELFDELARKMSELIEEGWT
jgi:hypothetical protein